MCGGSTAGGEPGGEGGEAKMGEHMLEPGRRKKITKKKPNCCGGMIGCRWSGGIARRGGNHWKNYSSESTDSVGRE